MGLITGLAIGAALGGGIFAGKKMANRGQQQAQTPPTAPAPSGEAMPQPPAVNPGLNMGLARQAGERQRKRAALGGATTRLLPKPGTVSRVEPKRLTGY